MGGGCVHDLFVSEQGPLKGHSPGRQEDSGLQQLKSQLQPLHCLQLALRVAKEFKIKLLLINSNQKHSTMGIIKEAKTRCHYL